MENYDEYEQWGAVDMDSWPIGKNDCIVKVMCVPEVKHIVKDVHIPML
jgi:hypothetical protein